MSNDLIITCVGLGFMMLSLIALAISISRQPKVVRTEPVDPNAYERDLDEGLQAVLDH